MIYLPKIAFSSSIRDLSYLTNKASISLDKLTSSNLVYSHLEIDLFKYFSTFGVDSIRYGFNKLLTL